MLDSTLWLLFALSFARIFLMGIQTRNVMGLHYKSAFCVSWLMTVAEVVVVVAIATNGWETFLPVAAGSSFGIVASMRVHEYFYRKKP